MLIALAVLVTIGAFILGITVSWLAKGMSKILSRMPHMLNQLPIQKCLMKTGTCCMMI